MIVRSCDEIKERRLQFVNLKIEEIIGILYELGNILLLEHKEEPEIIDIINVRDHMTLNEKVINE